MIYGESPSFDWERDGVDDENKSAEKRVMSPYLYDFVRGRGAVYVQHNRDIRILATPSHNVVPKAKAQLTLRENL
jgi:hypothetical protein